MCSPFLGAWWIVEAIGGMQIPICNKLRRFDRQKVVVHFLDYLGIFQPISFKYWSCGHILNLLRSLFLDSSSRGVHLPPSFSILALQSHQHSLQDLFVSSFCFEISSHSRFIQDSPDYSAHFTYWKKITLKNWIMTILTRCLHRGRVFIQLLQWRTASLFQHYRPL